MRCSWRDKQPEAPSRYKMLAKLEKRHHIFGMLVDELPAAQRHTDYSDDKDTAT